MCITSTHTSETDLPFKYGTFLCLVYFAASHCGEDLAPKLLTRETRRHIVRSPRSSARGCDQSIQMLLLLHLNNPRCKVGFCTLVDKVGLHHTTFPKFRVANSSQWTQEIIRLCLVHAYMGCTRMHMSVNRPLMIWLLTSNQVLRWSLSSTAFSIPVITKNRIAPETTTPRIQTRRAMFKGDFSQILQTKGFDNPVEELTICISYKFFSCNLLLKSFQNKEKDLFLLITKKITTHPKFCGQNSRNKQKKRRIRALTSDWVAESNRARRLIDLLVRSSSEAFVSPVFHRPDWLSKDEIAASMRLQLPTGPGVQEFLDCPKVKRHW